MVLPEWIKYEKQSVSLGKHEWYVPRLVELSKDFEVFEINLNCMNVYCKYDISLRRLVMHAKAFLEADLSYPIILDEDGEILDGRHRVMKALYLGNETIKAVKFDVNPEPCKINE